MQEKTAAVFVTCTKRKTQSPPSTLCLGSVPKGSPPAVARQWTRRLDAERDRAVPARLLYSGDHWHIASQLPNAAKHAGVTAPLWVISAGYGLIPHDAPVAAYSATFSLRHPDEIGRRFSTAPANPKSAWWDELARWTGPCPALPRRIQDVAARNPSAPVVVIASPSYLEAVESDLLATAGLLDQPSLLVIVAAGARKAGPLADFLVDCDSRFQAALGGARMSLNQRIARHILLHKPPWPWSAKGFSQTLAATCSTQRRPPPRLVTKITDADVKSYLRKKLAADPRSRPTGLLRELRGSGISCEQKRFKALFQEIAEARHG